MEARRPAPRRPSRRARRSTYRASGGSDPSPPESEPPADLRWTCAVIFVVGLALLALGGWGLARGAQRAAVAAGFGTAIVLGAMLIVFAALLPWLADGPVRLGPLMVTLRIRARRGRRGRRARRRRRM
jgi:hypothetical protein